jgi:hypothetical protein
MILCSVVTATEPVAGSSVWRRKWPTSAIVSVDFVWPGRNKFWNSRMDGAVRLYGPRFGRSPNAPSHKDINPMHTTFEKAERRKVRG